MADIQEIDYLECPLCGHKMSPLQIKLAVFELCPVCCIESLIDFIPKLKVTDNGRY